MPSNDHNGQKNKALAAAVEEWEASGKHRADLVRNVTTERTLYRYVNGEVKNHNPFITRQIARRLKKAHEELFGG